MILSQQLAHWFDKEQPSIDYCEPVMRTASKTLKTKTKSVELDTKNKTDQIHGQSVIVFESNQSKLNLFNKQLTERIVQFSSLR